MAKSIFVFVKIVLSFLKPEFIIDMIDMTSSPNIKLGYEISRPVLLAGFLVSSSVFSL